MKIYVYKCHNEDYSKNYIKAECKFQLLMLQTGEKLEVKYDFSPMVQGHSEKRFNTMFRIDDETILDDSGKYFANLTYWQRKRLVYDYGDLWIQKSDNVWKVVNFFLGLLSGWIIGYLTKC